MVFLESLSFLVAFTVAVEKRWLWLRNDGQLQSEVAHRLLGLRSLWDLRGHSLSTSREG